MDAADTLVLLSMSAGVASLGYLVLRRTLSGDSHDTSKEHTSHRPAATTAREEDTSVIISSGPESLVSVSARSAPRVPSSTNIAKLDYEEDEGIDPTKVGTNARTPNVAAVSPPPPSLSLKEQPPMKRIVYDEDAAVDEPTHVESLFLVSATAQTDTGKRRKRNEDSVLVCEEANLFVVADGMGGYRGGALASQLAVQTIKDAFKQRCFDGAKHAGGAGGARPDVPREARELASSMQRANEAILEVAACDKSLEGMGTTLCAARFSPNKKRLYIGHVGDSRCYRLRNGVLQQMTVDHTMRDFGVTGPESQQLSRAVGIWPAVPIDILMATPMPGDVYLLCSDGLNKMIPDETIAAVLENEEDPKIAVERLILFANSRGGKDNISVILVRVVPPDWKPTTRGLVVPTIADVSDVADVVDADRTEKTSQLAV